MSFDINVELDKIFVPGEPLSSEQRGSAGKELGAEYLKDRVRIVNGRDSRTVESDEFRRSDGAS